MKKILAIVLAVLMVAFAVSCGKTENDTPDTSAVSGSDTSAVNDTDTSADVADDAARDQGEADQDRAGPG
ncbi:MAG: hypothetical protein ACI4QZ_00515, partial [Eubacteriales bacterium]